jgi:hypothetical protein
MKVKELIEKLSKLDQESECVVVEDFLLDGMKMSAHSIGVNQVLVDQEGNAFYISKDDTPIYAHVDSEDQDDDVEYPQPTGELKKVVAICPLC